MAGIDDDFAAFLGGDTDTTFVDTRPDGRLLKVPLDRLAANGVNPRTDFGTPDKLLDLGRSLARRQNQPCPVVSRRAYLKLWPDHAEQVGGIDYVLVSGERRYRAATEVGLAGLECVVNDDIAKDRKTFMEAVVSENVDRENFNPIEEAHAVLALVKEFGTNRAVAEHFERVDGWVTQRVNLTYLCPELQDMVRRKDITLEDARTLGKLVKNRDVGPDAAAQRAWWHEAQEAKARKAAERKAAKAAARQQSAPAPTDSVASPSFTAVKPAPPEPETAAPSAAPVIAAQRAGAAPAIDARERVSDMPGSSQEGLQGSEPASPVAQTPAAAAGNPRRVQDPAETGGEEAVQPAQEQSPRLASSVLPWHDGAAMAAIVQQRMTADQQQVLLAQLLDALPPAVVETQAG